MANLKDVIYLSAEDYNTLYNNGTVTINGVTLTYDANNVYIIPDNTQAQIDAITALIPSSATTSNKLATASDISEITDLIPSTATTSNKLATANDIPTTLPASDVYSWAKASTKPSYSYSEISGTPSLGTDAYKSNIYSTGTTASFQHAFQGGHTYLVICRNDGYAFIAMFRADGSISSSNVTWYWTVLHNDSSKFSYETNSQGTLAIKYSNTYGTWPTLIIKIA